ncbi:MAG: GPW/gp25 family protein [Caldilineaceae bacterium]
MNTDIIGRGWAFPPHVNGHGNVAMTNQYSELEQSIRIILGTAQGERVMRPTFGSRLHELVFEPINTETMALARKYVEDALGMWEPRITVLDVQVAYPFQKQKDQSVLPGILTIFVRYEVNSTLDERTLVFPFATIPDE